MKSKKIGALLVAVVTVAMLAIAVPTIPAGPMQFTGLLGTFLVAVAPAAFRAPRPTLENPIKVHLRSTAKQKVLLGSNCYIGSPSQGNHESKLTSHCLA